MTGAAGMTREEDCKVIRVERHLMREIFPVDVTRVLGCCGIEEDIW